MATSLPAATGPLAQSADHLAASLVEAGRLPPAEPDVAEIQFGQFFKRPYGPAGLELTDQIRALEGRRVRILGFMVNQEHATPGVMILAPFALATDEHEYGLCDDLPPNVLFVRVPKYRTERVPYTPGPLLLTGRLEFGPQEEADGRVSHLRLVLDAEPAAAATHPASASAPAAVGSTAVSLSSR